jgi:cysteine desulfuration protein SufE
MTALDRSRKIIAELSAIPDQEDRFFHIMDMGKKSPGLDEPFKIPKYRIEGCASDLWLVPELKEGKCYFRTDSNAFITKGVASILAYVYSDATPEEVLALGPEFMRDAGVSQHLSPNRANGLASVARQIRLYAMAYKTLNLRSEARGPSSAGA